MRIGVIGPNQVLCLNEVELKSRRQKLSQLAEILALSGVEILLTPDKNSLLEYFGQEYLKNKGKKIYEIVPLEDDYEEYLNVNLGEIISCEKWPNQPAKFNEECDVFLCVGYGAMTLAEIGFSRYYKPKQIFIIEDFISTKLPEEIGLNIKYIKISEVEDIINNI